MTSLSRLASAARRLVPAELDETRSAAKHRAVVQCGVIWELAYPIKPSMEELSKALSVSKSYAAKCLADWRELPWQDRYAWLQLGERRARETETVDAAVLR
jgi:hypothetical protein